MTHLHARGGEPPLQAGLSPSFTSAPGAALASTMIGGFECSTKRRADGRRLDLIETTGHGAFCSADYRLLREQGIATARDGLRWHLIEPRPGIYDWSSFIPMLQASQGSNLQVIWDLCHYGWPNWLDIWSDYFVDAFARYAAAAARIIIEETGSAPYLCPINEISYWAWGGGEVGLFAPAVSHRGGALKRQLVRASIAATDAVRDIAPGARFLHAEPLIHVVASSPDDAALCAAESYRIAQFEALDMLTGRLAPELGGRPDCIDVVGVNFYPHNQWYLGGNTIPLGFHAYRPLREMLAEAHARFARPLTVAETGAEGTARASWLHYVAAEVVAARKCGIPVEGICLYPILDYPGWDNDRACAVGLFSAPDAAGRRTIDTEFAAEVRAQAALLGSVGVSRDALRSA